MSKGSSGPRHTKTRQESVGIKSFRRTNQSSKSFIQIGGSVRRRVGERAASPSITPAVKHGGGSVMELEAFANYKVRDLHQVMGKLNQTGYHKILQHHVFLSGTRLVAQGFVIMQDNDPKHTSKLCQR